MIQDELGTLLSDMLNNALVIDNMKQYTIDYTKVAEAEKSLYSALRFLRNNYPILAEKHIEKACTLLREYLAADNLVEDTDLADGLVRFSEVEELINN